MAQFWFCWHNLKLHYHNLKCCDLNLNYSCSGRFWKMRCVENLSTDPILRDPVADAVLAVVTSHQQLDAPTWDVPQAYPQHHAVRNHRGQGQCKDLGMVAAPGTSLTIQGNNLRRVCNMLFGKAGWGGVCLRGCARLLHGEKRCSTSSDVLADVAFRTYGEALRSHRSSHGTAEATAQQQSRQPPQHYRNSSVNMSHNSHNPPPR